LQKAFILLAYKTNKVLLPQKKLLNLKKLNYATHNKIPSLFLVSCLLFVACTKNKPTNIYPEKLLGGGTWQLTKWQKVGTPWRDSFGIYYKFALNDTMVETNRYNALPICKRRYYSSNGSGLKTIDVTFLYDCWYANHTINIEAIDDNNVTIFYQNEIGGRIVDFKEQYRRY
jgi:hypothetical protein